MSCPSALVHMHVLLAYACVIGMYMWRTSSCTTAASVQIVMMLLINSSLRSTTTKLNSGQSKHWVLDMYDRLRL